MRKIYLFTVLFLMSLTVAQAQKMSVTGKVVSKDDGSAVIGAAVVVDGTSTGAVTDFNGEFAISADKSATLVVSYIGMETIEVAAKPKMVIELVPSAQEISSVVVTAMGISRSEKSLGYSATAVAGDDLIASQTSDVMSGLAGKVAGVQVTPSAGAGGSNSVVIRGMSSLSGSNQPLYVVDGVPLTNSAVFSDNGLDAGYDFGSGANAINPADVESMTILKGAAATALYGSRAAAGVILVTTKAGSSTGKMQVEYNGGIQFESILRLPEMQNQFGQGWDSDALVENGSWGPAFNGKDRVWGSIYNNSQKVKSYEALEDNIRDFFDTGFRYNNSISVQGGNEGAGYYASFSQVSDDGIIPTDKDNYKKYTFSTRGNYTYKNLTVSSSLNYTQETTNVITTGQGLTMLNSLYQIPRDISIVDMADLSDPFNSIDYYFTPYSVVNPYYVIENSLNEYKAGKMFGKVQADYKILDNLTATYRLGLDVTDSERKVGTPEMYAAEGTPNYTQIAEDGSVTKQMVRRKELNHDFLFAYNTKVSDFDINAIAGANINERTYSSLEVTVKGLDIDGWHNLANSSATPSYSEYQYIRRMVGVFGQVEASYKSMAYLTATARNDWSSTLPMQNNSFFYPGVTGSFIFTEVMPSSTKDILSFGKVRMAWGQTGSDANVYVIDPVYIQSLSDSGIYSDVTFPLGGKNGFTMSNALADLNLQPEITTEFEVGASLSFFQGRINVDGAYYNRVSNNQIFSLNMDAATGYTMQTTNLGEIGNKGIELLVDVTPIETKDFTWNLSVNYTKNNSEVISLPKEMGGRAVIYGLSGSTSLVAIEGQPLGMFEAQVPLRDDAGHIICGTDGLPMFNPNMQIIGDMNYDYELGLATSFRYKNLSLSANFDVRQGGLMYSRTKDINYFVGNAVQTTYNDRNTFIVPNSVNENVAADGSVSYSENIYPISSSNILTYWEKGGSNGGSDFLIDKSYVKLRSLNIGYSLPKDFVKSLSLTDVKVSVYGNNLFLWTAASNTFIDPDLTSFGNDLSGRYGEYTATPSTRNYGVSLSVKF